MPPTATRMSTSSTNPSITPVFFFFNDTATTEIYTLSLHDALPISFHSRTKKIVVPDDIKGMKIRPAHATMATFMTQLGGTNVNAAAPEVRDAIERGVAEAVTFPWGSIPLFGIDKVTKYHMEYPLYVTTFAFVFNKSTYNQMSAAQRKVIDDHCTNEGAAKVARPWADLH